jgi:hypothetical protein
MLVQPLPGPFTGDRFLVLDTHLQPSICFRQNLRPNLTRNYALLNRQKPRLCNLIQAAYSAGDWNQDERGGLSSNLPVWSMVTLGVQSQHSTAQPTLAMV